MSELNYLKNGDYLVPNLSMTEADTLPLGKYGRMRETYLKEHRPILYNSLLLSGKLMTSLQETDQTAHRRLEQFMAEQTQTQKLTEQMKASDPLNWVAQMNSLKAQAEELIQSELIYA